MAVLLVDEREGGGQAHAKFHALCDALEREGARFETCRLPEGDYLWVEQRAGAGGGAVQVRELPRLIERKAANDVAASLKDGRWSRQQARMAAHSARAHRGGARLEYIIEDEVSREEHACPRCTHMAGAARGVGGCPQAGWPTRGAVDAALAALTRDGYTVTRTGSLLETARYLAAEQREMQAELTSSSKSSVAAVGGAAAGAAAGGATTAGGGTSAAGTSAEGAVARGKGGGGDGGGVFRGGGGSSQESAGSSAGGEARLPFVQQKARRVAPPLAAAAAGAAGAAVAAGAGAGASPKPKRAAKAKAPRSAAAGAVPPKKPRRPEGHPAAAPARGSGVGFEQPLPRAKSCQWAYLVAMHRAELKAGEP